MIHGGAPLLKREIEAKDTKGEGEKVNWVRMVERLRGIEWLLRHCFVVTSDFIGYDLSIAFVDTEVTGSVREIIKLIQ